MEYNSKLFNMEKKNSLVILMLVAIIIIATVVLVVLYFSIEPKTGEEMIKDNQEDVGQNDEMIEENKMTEDDSVMEDETMKSSGTYSDYDSSKLALADSEKVVLFFHASWCPTCRTLDSSLKNSGVPAGVNILKVDYDSSTDLRQKYGVTYQHTLVQVDSNGDLINKWTGSPDINSIVANIQ